jgi:hypothetical protein
MCCGGAAGVTFGSGGKRADPRRGPHRGRRGATAASTSGNIGGGTGDEINPGLPRLLPTLPPCGLVLVPDPEMLGSMSCPAFPVTPAKCAPSGSPRSLHEEPQTVVGVGSPVVFTGLSTMWIGFGEVRGYVGDKAGLGNSCRLMT